MLFLSKNKLPILLSILAFASLFLNFVLYQRLNNFQLTLNSLSLDPVNLDRYSQENAEEMREVGKPIVVFFGDSRVVAWREPELANWQFINRGISGETSAQAALRFRDHVSYLQPDIVIVQICINDFRMRPLPPQSRKDIVENCQKNVDRIVAESEAMGAKTILTTVFPLGKGDIPLNVKPVWQSVTEIDKSIDEANSYIRSLDDKNNLTVFDAYAVIEAEGKTKDSYKEDILHINKYGYEALNEKLAEILSKKEY